MTHTRSNFSSCICVLFFLKKLDALKGVCFFVVLRLIRMFEEPVSTKKSTIQIKRIENFVAGKFQVVQTNCGLN